MRNSKLKQPLIPHLPPSPWAIALLDLPHPTSMYVEGGQETGDGGRWGISGLGRRIKLITRGVNYEGRE
jgi:hypothetical protein